MIREEYGSRHPVDEVTRLYEEDYFFNSILESEISRSKRHYLNFSLARINLNNLSQVGDKYKKEVKDQFLSEIGEALIKRSRVEEPIARYSDSSFLFLLIGTDENGALGAAQRMKRVVLESTCLARVQDLGVKVTMSAGTSTYPADGKEKEALINKVIEDS
ncbi:MAG: diguanylate cyclase [bacterium]|nr:diguanylate cyclase [bacterium]